MIVVCNDDGITAPGIQALVSAMEEIGDVLVVAPDGPQSGMGHAITIGNTLRLDRSTAFPNHEAYECSGTPADCIKMAKHQILKDRKPDLVVSGINHGSNSSISVLYSGTMSAVIEAAIEGSPAIGFSLCDYEHEADFSHTLPYVQQLARLVLENGLPNGVCLNVNFPKQSKEKLKGLKVCRQARAQWREEFEERLDPRGRRYFWMLGSFVNEDLGEDTDEYAIANNYVSVVPVQFDLTAHHAIAVLNQWELQ